MNIKAIIASLVVGSSSIAMAQPSVTVSATAHGSYSTTVVRDRPAPAPVAYHEGGVWRGNRLPAVRRPVTLSSGTHFANDGRTFIQVGPQVGRFGTLQITGDRGRTFIKQVYVQFDNGQEQVLRNLDRTLVGNQSLTLDLDGNRRGIARIVVYGNELLSGWRRSGATFTVTAS